MSSDALAHALSGAAGTAIATAATYPLDLVTTRLKAQQPPTAPAPSQPASEAPPAGPPRRYGSVLAALRAVRANEGGVGALYAGLAADLGKSIADSFLFFLFLAWLRGRRLARRGALGELAAGMAAGAAARLLTTPVANIVARKQLAGSAGGKTPGSGALARELAAEGGVRGLWAGYGASLVLTLNPGLTFFLHAALRRLAGAEEGEGAVATFLLAAVSKAAATAATYPFQTARARAQAGAEGGGVFAEVGRLARAGGAAALYAGLGGELVKAFAAHGVTMLAKDTLHGAAVQLVAAPGRIRRSGRAAAGKGPGAARALGRRFAELSGAGEAVVVNLLSSSRRAV